MGAFPVTIFIILKRFTNKNTLPSLFVYHNIVYTFTRQAVDYFACRKDYSYLCIPLLKSPA